MMDLAYILGYERMPKEKTGRSKMDEKEIEHLFYRHSFVTNHGVGSPNLMTLDGFRRATHAIAEAEKMGIVWEGDAWAWVNGLVNFEPANNCIIPEELTALLEDGEAVWMIIKKLASVKEE
jgi:hypothetical protein